MNGKNIKRISRRLGSNDSLYLLAELGVVGLLAIMPAAAVVAYAISAAEKKYGKSNQKKIRNSFYSLKSRGLLKQESRHGKTVLMLSKEAEQMLKVKELQSITEQKRKTAWDKKWYVVLFDIKNKNTQARNALRVLLRKFGFLYLQRSAWVFPYDCRKELYQLKDFFRLNDSEITVLECTSVGNDEEMKRKFNLK